MGNYVPPPAPPSIPPEHPLLSSRIHSSSHGFGFFKAFAVSSESRPSSFGLKVGTRRGLQGCAASGKCFGKLPVIARALGPWAGGKEAEVGRDCSGGGVELFCPKPRCAIRRGVVRKDSRASNACCSKRDKVTVPFALHEKGTRHPLPNTRKVLGALRSKHKRC